MTVPTKTVNFDDDVLTILQTLGVRAENGHYVGILTCGQLERKLYERTNKALEALGGKWNRKAGGHVFATDPRERLAALLDEGRLIIERDGFFETPRTVVEQMLELVPFNRTHDILEPSAGLGAIARVLREYGAQNESLKLIEKNEQRVEELRRQLFYAECGDFLTYNAGGWDRIYMNPPFENGQDVDHVLHAYWLLDEGGEMVSVMSEGAFFRGDWKSVKFRKWLDECHGETFKLPPNSFKESGTGVNTRLIVLRK